MATNTVKVTLQIRHDEAADWTTRNPVLAAGEYGLESDTFFIEELLDADKNPQFVHGVLIRAEMV